jgi:hypothetical protein
MEKALFAAAPMFGDVIFRVLKLEDDTTQTFNLSPEQAKSLAKALGKAARAAEEHQKR